MRKAQLPLDGRRWPRAWPRVTGATNRPPARAKMTNSRRRWQGLAPGATRRGVCAAWLKILADQGLEAKMPRSVDRAQHAVPARARGYLDERAEDTHKAAPERALAVIFFGTLHRPVDHHRPAHNRFAIDEAPVAAVPAVVSIVSHGEIVAGRHDHFPILDVFEDLICPFRLHAGD